MNKKGSTFTGAVFAILLVMGLFYGMYDYISYNYESANITEVVGYNQSYADLQTAEENLDTNIEAIKTSAQNIAEADGSAVSVAWNGLTGLAATVRLFLGIIDIAINVWDAVVPALSFLPNWVKILIEMGLILWIVLIVVGKLSGETKS